MLSINRNISNISKRFLSQKTFHIYKYNSYTPSEKQESKEYTIDTEKSGEMMIDVLMNLKNKKYNLFPIDKPCQEGICGSCAVKINGTDTLACLCYLKDIPDYSKIYPLHNMNSKDIVLNMIYSHKTYSNMRFKDSSELSFIDGVKYITCIYFGCLILSVPLGIIMEYNGI